MQTDNIKASLVIPVCVALAGCATAGPNLTPLQIETMQTQEYETDKNTAFSSVVSVFQTLGYTIKVANKDTGIITAESLSKSTAPSFGDFIFDAFTTSTGNVKSYSVTVNATAFVESFKPGVSQVRLNFVNSRLAEGGNRVEKQILKPKHYQNAFEKIANAIFVRASTK